MLLEIIDMNNRNYLLKYAIEYLSKYSSSKKNLDRIIKSKIKRLSSDKKIRFELYKEISHVIDKLEKNNLLSDENYSFTKIQSFANQGKSKNFIKNYLYYKGIDNKIIIQQLDNYEKLNTQWEKKSAKKFAEKKKLLNSNEIYEKKLAKMARAGFSYDLCKEILN